MLQTKTKTKQRVSPTRNLTGFVSQVSTELQTGRNFPPGHVLQSCKLGISQTSSLLFLKLSSSNYSKLLHQPHVVTTQPQCCEATSPPPHKATLKCLAVLSLGAGLGAPASGKAFWGVQFVGWMAPQLTGGAHPRKGLQQEMREILPRRP